VKFCVEVIRMMACSTDEFRENLYSASRCLLNGLDEMLPLVFYIFLPIWIIFGTGDVHTNLLIYYEFCENRRNENRTLIWDVIEFISVLATLSIRLGRNSP